MRRQARALLALSLLAVAAGGCARRSLNQVVQRDLRSRGDVGDVGCRGYLGWNGGDVQHVFLWMSGTGIYSSAFVHPSAERALTVNPAAYLTFDKPGIRAPFQDPAAMRVDDGEVQRYTQGHMLECARQAMAWADERFGPTTRFHLRGHSEGTLIALFLLDELLSQRPSLRRQGVQRGAQRGGPRAIRRAPGTPALTDADRTWQHVTSRDPAL